MEQKFPPELEIPDAREDQGEALRNFYIVARFNAFYTTVFLIFTFCAETLLNTIRLNDKLKAMFSTLLSPWQLVQYFQGFYPAGDKPIEIIASAHVYIYIFALALYAAMRLVHHKALPNEKDWPGVHPEKKVNLDKLPFLTRWCWKLSPKERVHQYVMFLWMWWGVVPLLATFPLSWLGVRVYSSDFLVTALIGSSIVFGVNLVEGSGFFKRIPAKDVLGKIALSVITLCTRRDFTAFVRDMSGLAEGIKNGEISATHEDILLLEKVVERAHQLFLELPPDSPQQESHSGVRQPAQIASIVDVVGNETEPSKPTIVRGI